MKRTFESYRRVGHRFVSGWLESEVLAVLTVLNSLQRAKNVSGAVAEIGVHHGKLFIALKLLQEAGERAVAIDVFDDQDLNVDNSGKGNLEAFRKNIQRWSGLDGVEIHKGDSTKMHPEELSASAGAAVRLFSVDGGHTDSIVFSDMVLAERTLCDAGIVIADDIFNESWPDVAVGTLRYLAQNSALVPFAIGFNKVFFSQPPYAPYYRDSLLKSFENRVLISARRAEFANHDVVILARTPRRLHRLAGRISIVRATYNQLQQFRKR